MYGFQLLDTKDGYCDVIARLYRDAPEKIKIFLSCSIDIDHNEIEKSYDEYSAYIEYFSKTLNSGNPDQYKRAGSLLLALNEREIVKNISYNAGAPVDVDDECFLPMGLSLEDKRHILPYLEIFKKNPNSVMAFNICYRLMAQYEQKTKNLLYSLEYFEVISALLGKDKFVKNHKIISPDAAFLIFKSLAQ